MSAVQIYHNPNCSTSRFAVESADDAGVDYGLVKYMLKSERPGRQQLEDLLDKLEDPATDLVRRDAKFRKLGLTEDDVATRDGVLNVLTDHPELLQRPVLVKGDRAIIGRPRERVADFLAGS